MVLVRAFDSLGEAVGEAEIQEKVDAKTEALDALLADGRPARS